MKRQKNDTILGRTPPRSDFDEEDRYARRHFRKLSYNKREQLIKDICGIPESRDETVQFITTAFQKFEHELERYVGKNEWLDHAREEHPAMFESERFRLRFLRRDNYNAKLAAQRYARFFDRKLQLLDLEKLGMEISLNDLDECNIKTMHYGGFQPPSEKGRGGRSYSISEFLADCKNDLLIPFICLY